MSKQSKQMPKVWAVVWVSGWGNIPDSLVAGFFKEEDAKAHPLAGQDTYDGVSASTQGHYAVMELEPPQAVGTVFEQGYEFGECAGSEYGIEVGAWKGDKPHPKRWNGDEWNWTEAESRYLQAWNMARKVQEAEEVMKAAKGSRRVTLHLIPEAFDRLADEAGEGGSLSDAANRIILGASESCRLPMSQRQEKIMLIPLPDSKIITVKGFKSDLNRLPQFYKITIDANNCVEINEQTGTIRASYTDPEDGITRHDYWPELPGLRETMESHAEFIENSILNKNSAME